MRGAILLVDHGSRRAEANAQLGTIAKALHERIQDTIIEIAHLEIEPPDIAMGIDRCVERGATAIVVVPYLLGAGRHSTSDIPTQVAAAGARHTGIEIRLADPLGGHPAIIDILLDRIATATLD